MVTYLGDFNTTETVRIPFNAFTSDDPSASATITNLAAGDVEIHKDGSTTQRASDNGVTVSIDFDGVTGNHVVSIDLSDNSDAGFYSAGSRYMVRIEGTTVDGGTVNAWIGTFSIGCVLRPSVAGRTLGVESDGDLTKVNTLDGHTPQTGDSYAIVNNGTYGNSALNADIDAILADTNEMQGKLPTNNIIGSSDKDNHDTDIDTLLTRCTALRLAELDPANLPTDIASVKSDTASILVDTNEMQGKLPSGTISNLTLAQIIAGISDGSLDLQEMLRIMFAVLAGKTTNNGTIFRDSSDTKDRAIGVFDANKNRTSMTYDGS
jgi:hypothetical protein